MLFLGRVGEWSAGKDGESIFYEDIVSTELIFDIGREKVIHVEIDKIVV